MDVDAAIDCGADAIGLNFYSASPRFVRSELARQLTGAIAKRAMAVGVFVNKSPAEVGTIVRDCHLDCVQLHGDEEPEWMEQARNVPSLHGISVIKAVAWRDLPEDRACVERWRISAEDAIRENDSATPRLIGFLVDSFDPVQRGGTGKTARWDLLDPRPKEFGTLPILLAGGITPANALEAQRTAKPDGLDVASGIESEPGIKDAIKMRLIASAVQR